VLSGRLHTARFTAHGPDKKKWLQFANQPSDGPFAGRVQVTAGSGDPKGNILLNVFPQDITRVSAVLLRAYLAMRDVSESYATWLLGSAANNYKLAAQAAALKATPAPSGAPSRYASAGN